MSLRERFWPHIADEHQAEMIAYYGLYGCIIKTAIAIIYSQWLEGILFGVVGIGIYKLSRIAAVVGLALYVTEKMLVLVQGGNLFSGGLYLLLFVYAFINGVRGTIAYHGFLRMKRGLAMEVEREVHEQ